MSPAAAAPLAWRQVQLLLKKTRKIMFILESRLRGDFFDGELSFSEEIAGANQAEFEQVLVRPKPGMGGKSAAKPAVTDAQFARQKLHVQLARIFVLNAGYCRFDDVGILSFPGRLGLLSRVKQAEQVRGGASEDLLQGRAVGANRMDHSAECGEHRVLSIDFEDRIFRRYKTMPEP